MVAREDSMNGPSNTIDKADEAQLLATIDRWVEREVAPRVKEFDHADRWPAELVEQMKELGLFGATVSPAYGGLGLPAPRRRELGPRAADAPRAARARLGRGARRPGAARARRRHRPAGDPARRAARRCTLSPYRKPEQDVPRHRG